MELLKRHDLEVFIIIIVSFLVSGYPFLLYGKYMPLLVVEMKRDLLTG